jgi:hypothetical protein
MIYLLQFNGDERLADSRRLARWFIPVLAADVKAACVAAKKFLSAVHDNDEALKDIAEIYLDDIIEIDPERFAEPSILLFRSRLLSPTPLESEICRPIPAGEHAGLECFGWGEDGTVEPFLKFGDDDGN